jgi:hypothetical protein
MYNTFRQKRNLFLQVTARSVRLFLEVPAKKERSSFFLEPRFLQIPGSFGIPAGMHNLSKNPRALLNDLEAIEQVMDEKHSASLKAKAKEASAASAAAKGSSKKRSTSGSSGELQVPKKARPSKFSQHCKAKGRPHLTHNKKECRRYNGNWNPISLFQGKPVNAKKPAKKGGDKQMAYLTATVESLVKKGLRKQ